MQYISTRGQTGRVQSAQAIKQGIAPDGGLFVPENLVPITEEKLRQLVGSDYRQLAREILTKYLTDYTEDEVQACVTGAYSEERFDHPDIAPVHTINEQLHVLELWHGPTCAFKDMALQLLPRLMPLAAGKTGEKDEIVILVATSGDTGKAALEGFKNVNGTKIIVFFPEDGVSRVQRLQMITQEGANVNVVAVQGNFDDAQSGVKQVFGDADFNQRLKERHYRLSSANSINWGRLVPQIIYYFAAYLKLVSENRLNIGERVNFVVPTGNFGNILAGYYAKQMGLPVNRLICAANPNNVLTDFINTGVYDRNRVLVKTISPSMDILISSNLERLLFDLTGCDDGRIRGWMNELQGKGRYAVDEETKVKVQSHFWSHYASDEDTMRTIKAVWEEYNYLVDTHTAVAFNVYRRYREQTGDTTKTVVVSTASPFKFNASVAKAVLGADKTEGKSEFILLNMLWEYTGWPVPQGLKNLEQKPVLHNQKTPAGGIGKAVAEILGV
ncbi:threonine synthase [Desulfohalotomaculum tongense]|uniref:threonine synthase n=1 Tax=Desulforadius tongensis TaxID=1216062 RepID=UPI001957A497|nr:threonine synthase [Desulforadius tongensis]MBM7854857.1 threonine synthase [Desulforadius tongensis]